MEDNKVETPEQEVQEQTEATPEVNITPPVEPKSKKKLWITIVVVATLVVSAALWYVLSRDSSDTQSIDDNKTETSEVVADEAEQTSEKKYSKIVAFVNSELVQIYDTDTEATATVYEKITGICDREGCPRSISVSPNGRYIAFDYAGENEESPVIAFYDRDTSEVNTTVPGSVPIWSPDSSKIAFYDEQGVGSYDINSEEVSYIQDSGLVKDSNGSISASPLMIGWASDTQVVFYQRPSVGSPEPPIFNIGDTQTGANQVVSIQGLSDDETIRRVLMTNQLAKLLIEKDLDPGYDAGVVNLDGTGFVSVSGNTDARWPGSGFSIAGSSPDGSKVLLANIFIPADQSINRASGKYEIHNLDGSLVSSLDELRATSDPVSCWLTDTTIFLTGSKDSEDNQTDRLYRFSTGDNSLELITELLFSGSPKLSCNP